MGSKRGEYGLAGQVSMWFLTLRNLFDVHNPWAWGGTASYALIPEMPKSISISCAACKEEGSVTPAVAECDGCGDPVCGEHHVDREEDGDAKESRYAPALASARGRPMRYCARCLSDGM